MVEYMWHEIGGVQVGGVENGEEEGEEPQKIMYGKGRMKLYFFYTNLKSKTKEKTCTFSL